MPASINNNLMAANVANNLNSHYGKLATSVERLSSGLRINSAADDAAGLAIRELMRGDVAALNHGVRNANDAISMLQVADGALGIIDEKLIRMKELAEQAATGTYNSTQRLMIHSEFVAMAEEIDRIARATDFNGIKLLDGSLSGAHDGSGLTSTGKMKIHFGSANDSAEDYYYIDIGDCTTGGLGLREPRGAVDNSAINTNHDTAKSNDDKSVDINKPTTRIMQMPPLNDCSYGAATVIFGRYPGTPIMDLQDRLPQQGVWYKPSTELSGGVVINQSGFVQNFIFTIPKGTKNILINTWGTGITTSQFDGPGDQDIQLFTKNGVHLSGTPLNDIVYTFRDIGWMQNSIEDQSYRLGFSVDDYDDSYLNTGPDSYDPSGQTLKYSTYNGMTIGYSGDPELHDVTPNNGLMETWEDYEVLTIDEAVEDLVVWVVGAAGFGIKAYWDLPDDPDQPDPPNPPGPDVPTPALPQGDIISIKTQDEAQQALERIDDAIVAKDKVRAHLGALQNRLENTVTNLTVQSENLQTAESRISDIDTATEMTALVRNQVLTQSAVAMLGQANSYPHMLSGLING